MPGFYSVVESLISPALRPQGRPLSLRHKAGPDGTWAFVGELCEGGYGHKSDDYEIVPLEDVERLRELGIADELS